MLSIKNTLKLATALFTVYATVSCAEPPSGGRGGPQGGPPAEATQACASLTEGAACSFTGGRGEAVTGTCATPPQGDAALACKPADGGKRPPMPGNAK